jgi:hypothetical protein
MYEYFDQQQREHKWPWVSLQEWRRNCRDEDRVAGDGPGGADAGDDGDSDAQPG